MALVSLATIAPALIARQILVPVIGYDAPYLTVYPAALILAFYSGPVVGVVLGIAAAFGAQVLFAEPIGGYAIGIATVLRILIIAASAAAAGYVGNVVRESAGAQTRLLAETRQWAERLRQTQDLLEKTASGTGQFLAAVDTNYRFTAMNVAYREEFRRVFGVDVDAGSSLVEALAHLPGEREKAVSLWGQAIAGEAVSTIAEFGDPGRARATYALRLNPIFDDSGRITGAGETAIDVTDRVRAEEALRESENSLRVIFDSTYDSILTHTPDGRIVDVNAVFLRMYGTSREKALHLAIPDFSSSDSPLETLPGLWAKVLADQPQRFQWKARRIDNGSLFDVEVFLRRVRMRGADYVLANVRDITEEKRAAQALRESEERFRQLADSMPQLVWTALPDGRVDYYNNRFREFGGIVPGPDGHWNWAPVVHPDERQKTIDAWNHSVRTGEIYQIEHRVQRADGSFRWYLSRGVPQRAPSGEIVRWFGTATDIDQVKRADEALRRSEERFRTLADNISQFAWMAERNGWVFWYNQRWFEYTGMSSDELIKSGWWSVHHPDHAERVRTKYYEHVEAGERWEDTFPLRGRDGRYRWFLSSAMPIRNETGEVVRWFGTSTDVTDLRDARERAEELREEAERANKGKDEFLAVLSHELRTPLTSILGWSQILLRPNVPPDRSAHAIEVIHESAKTQTRLIEDLLDVSRILSGRFTIEKSTVDLIDVVRAAVDTVRPSAEAKNISLALLYPPDSIAPISGDSARLRQAIWNLMHNAIKFTSGGGRIELSITLSDSSAVVTVSDTRMGISADYLPRIFERFSQAEGGPARYHAGLGLGLAIVKHVLEVHGGTIKAESPGPGLGAKFTMTLPLEAPTFAAPPEIVPVERSLAGMHVLLVEDELMIRDLVQVILEDEGAEVMLAESAAEARDLLDAEEFDLLLCDIGLPGEDGYSLMRDIRVRLSETELPAIAFTGYGRPEDKEAAESAGFQAHFTKPMEADSLVRRVKELALNGRQRGPLAHRRS